MEEISQLTSINEFRNCCVYKIEKKKKIKCNVCYTVEPVTTAFLVVRKMHRRTDEGKSIGILRDYYG